MTGPCLPNPRCTGPLSNAALGDRLAACAAGELIRSATEGEPVTEAEWLVTGDDPRDMLEHVENLSPRKWRLFLCGCARGAGHALTAEVSRAATDAAERFADGTATVDELTEAGRRAYELVARNSGEMSPADRAVWDALTATYTDHSRAYESAVWNFTVFGQGAARSDAEYARYCELLRDIYGNPFHSVTFSPEWRTNTPLSLARQMYESRDFSAMLILADALQDAGCDNDGILNHCRGPGPHVRGCWVLDLVLGKE
jgi:hypothetical protein